MQALLDLRARLIYMQTTGGVAALKATIKDPSVQAQIEDKVIEQLKRGERGDGSKLPNYSPVSVAKFNKPAGPIRLFDEGNYYRGHIVEVDDKGFEVQNIDSKAEMLAVKYGDEIKELQDRSMEELKEDVILPNFIPRFLKQFFA